MPPQLPRYVCIHGHFYQPPRENPWLEAIELQDSAAPYHDWNERITRECYAPNSRSRLVDAMGKIIGLSNNYGHMSFNFGPTLLSWMQLAAPDVLKGIIEGDRLSMQRQSGHGNALAQVYNHVIMPLASAHDKRTQVLWGCADFLYRFGRPAEGMWLSETAVDLASLEALAEAGMGFTILAPHQARRWRRLGDSEWIETGDAIDLSRAYLCRLPSGKSIALFFYNGGLARQVAFERLLDNGDRFLEQLLKGIDSNRQHAQLLHIATDGESYGHHHAHGDMALAYVLDRLGKDPAIRLTNYGEFLDLHPPEWEVEIHENSSWSCAHGIERWRSNCGCNTGRGWQQEWRGPLREAFDWLKNKLDELLVAEARDLFVDPWAARDAYVTVLLDRRDENVDRFVRAHCQPDLGPNQVRQGLWLLEMQRHGMFMYTSCGWFFDEISGIETTQCLRYAGRAMQLARHFDQDFEEEFLKLLEKAPSNLPRYPNGRGVWEELVRPSRVDLDRVLAHFAMSSIFAPPTHTAQVYCYDLEVLDQQVHTRGESHLSMGHLRVRSRLTRNEAETQYVIMHFGGLDFHTVLDRARLSGEYEVLRRQLLQKFDAGSLAEVTEMILLEFPGAIHRVDDLFTDERRRIISIILQRRLEDYRGLFARLADQDESVLTSLGRLHYPMPMPFRAVAAVTLDQRLLEQIETLNRDDNLAAIQQRIERGRSWNYTPVEPERLRCALEEQLLNCLQEIPVQSELAALTQRAGKIIEVAGMLGMTLDLWRAQNQLLDAYRVLADSGKLNPGLREAFTLLADRLNISAGLLGWRP